jgi:signal transduction histidine kinase
MTGGIAHDFRNILCIVASGLRVAGRELDNPDKLKSALAAIHDGVERGERMVSRLLRFARQQDLDARPEDVNTLLRKLEAFLKYGAGTGFRIDLSLAAGLPECLVDPPRFNAAILNLVVNARDAMPEGGIIRISTAAVRRTQHGGPREYVRVRVRDHGSGMSAEVLERIFDPYFTTKGESGTGLGVPQVQALLQEVDGFVRVDTPLVRARRSICISRLMTSRLQSKPGNSSTSGRTKAGPFPRRRWSRGSPPDDEGTGIDVGDGSENQ